jgi:hypothetical protein
MSWEETFQSWAKASGETEQTKCDNAVRAVRKAIDASALLKGRSIRVFAQGSYCNRTNVRTDSDVDVCVLCTEVCFVDYALSEGLTDKDVGLVNHPFTYAEFKNEVEKALRSHFGSAGVSRGNKAFVLRLWCNLPARAGTTIPGKSLFARFRARRQIRNSSLSLAGKRRRD